MAVRGKQELCVARGAVRAGICPVIVPVHTRSAYSYRERQTSAGETESQEAAGNERELGLVCAAFGALCKVGCAVISSANTRD